MELEIVSRLREEQSTNEWTEEYKNLEKDPLPFSVKGTTSKKKPSNSNYPHSVSDFSIDTEKKGSSAEGASISTGTSATANANLWMLEGLEISKVTSENHKTTQAVTNEISEICHVLESGGAFLKETLVFMFAQIPLPILEKMLQDHKNKFSKEVILNILPIMAPLVDQQKLELFSKAYWGNDPFTLGAVLKHIRGPISNTVTITGLDYLRQKHLDHKINAENIELIESHKLSSDTITAKINTWKKVNVQQAGRVLFILRLNKKRASWSAYLSKGEDKFLEASISPDSRMATELNESKPSKEKISQLILTERIFKFDICPETIQALFKRLTKPYIDSTTQELQSGSLKVLPAPITESSKFDFKRILSNPEHRQGPRIKIQIPVQKKQGKNETQTELVTLFLPMAAILEYDKSLTHVQHHGVLLNFIKEFSTKLSQNSKVKTTTVFPYLNDNPTLIKSLIAVNNNIIFNYGLFRTVLSSNLKATELVSFDETNIADVQALFNQIKSNLEKKTKNKIAHLKNETTNSDETQLQQALQGILSKKISTKRIDKFKRELQDGKNFKKPYLDSINNISVDNYQSELLKLSQLIHADVAQSAVLTLPKFREEVGKLLKQYSLHQQTALIENLKQITESHLELEIEKFDNAIVALVNINPELKPFKASLDELKAKAGIEAKITRMRVNRIVTKFYSKRLQALIKRFQNKIDEFNDVRISNEIRQYFLSKEFIGMVNLAPEIINRKKLNKKDQNLIFEALDKREYKIFLKISNAKYGEFLHAAFSEVGVKFEAELKEPKLKKPQLSSPKTTNSNKTDETSKEDPAEALARDAELKKLAVYLGKFDTKKINIKYPALELMCTELTSKLVTDADGFKILLGLIGNKKEALKSVSNKEFGQKVADAFDKFNLGNYEFTTLQKLNLLLQLKKMQSQPALINPEDLPKILEGFNENNDHALVENFRQLLEQDQLQKMLPPHILVRLRELLTAPESKYSTTIEHYIQCSKFFEFNSVVASISAKEQKEINQVSTEFDKILKMEAFGKLSKKLKIYMEQFIFDKNIYALNELFIMNASLQIHFPTLKQKDWFNIAFYSIDNENRAVQRQTYDTLQFISNLIAANKFKDIETIEDLRKKFDEFKFIPANNDPDTNLEKHRLLTAKYTINVPVKSFMGASAESVSMSYAFFLIYMPLALMGLTWDTFDAEDKFIKFLVTNFSSDPSKRKSQKKSYETDESSSIGSGQEGSTDANSNPTNTSEFALANLVTIKTGSNAERLYTRILGKWFIICSSTEVTLDKLVTLWLLSLEADNEEMAQFFMEKIAKSNMSEGVVSSTVQTSVTKLLEALPTPANSSLLFESITLHLIASLGGSKTFERLKNILQKMKGLELSIVCAQTGNPIELARQAADSMKALSKKLIAALNNIANAYNNADNDEISNQEDRKGTGQARPSQLDDEIFQLIELTLENSIAVEILKKEFADVELSALWPVVEKSLAKYEKFKQLDILPDDNNRKNFKENRTQLATHLKLYFAVRAQKVSRKEFSAKTEDYYETQIDKNLVSIVKALIEKAAEAKEIYPLVSATSLPTLIENNPTLKPVYLKALNELNLSDLTATKSKENTSTAHGNIFTHFSPPKNPESFLKTIDELLSSSSTAHVRSTIAVIKTTFGFIDEIDAKGVEVKNCLKVKGGYIQRSKEELKKIKAKVNAYVVSINDSTSKADPEAVFKFLASVVQLEIPGFESENWLNTLRFYHKNHTSQQTSVETLEFLKTEVIIPTEELLKKRQEQKEKLIDEKDILLLSDNNSNSDSRPGNGML